MDGDNRIRLDLEFVSGDDFSPALECVTAAAIFEAVEDS
jgi:hypothetical protein